MRDKFLCEQVGVIPTDVAFMQKVCQVRGIELVDFNRIHDEVFTYINCIKGEESHTQARLHSQYIEFINPFDNTLSINTLSLSRAMKILMEASYDLDKLLKRLSLKIRNKNMACIGLTQEYKQDKVLEDYYNSYLESVYHRHDVPIGVTEWLVQEQETVNTHLQVVLDNINLTLYQLEDKYLFHSQDFTFVFSLFIEQKEHSWEQALLAISSYIATEQQERAYLYILKTVLHAYSEGLDLKHWSLIINRVKNLKSFAPEESMS